MHRRKRCGEVGLHDCLMMMVVLSTGLYIASFGVKHFGWVGFLLGVPVGVVVAFGVLYGLLSLWVIVESLIIAVIFGIRNGWIDLQGGALQRVRELQAPADERNRQIEDLANP